MKISNTSLGHYTRKHMRWLRIGPMICGIKLEWNYVAQWVDIAMPVYAMEYGKVV